MPIISKVGMIVNYVLPENSKNAGSIRPAIIVRDWGFEAGHDAGNEQLVNLQVSTDGSNDGDQYAAGLVLHTSRKHSDDKEPGTWHYGSN